MRILTKLVLQSAAVATAILFLNILVSAQRNSIVIHHRSSGGGSKVESAFKSALEKQFPCVETMNDADIDDAIEDAREKEMLEGTDPQEVLTTIANRLGSSLVLTISSGPGVGGGGSYSGGVMDMKTGRSVARETASSDGDIDRMANSLVSQLGPQLAKNCKPHWTGSIRYLSVVNETKTNNDITMTRAMVRNVKRNATNTIDTMTQIKATLLPPKEDKDGSAAIARVVHRINFTASKSVDQSGEMQCRVPGKNPYWEGYSESYAEKTTQTGQGNDTMPVIISVDADGSYSIKVTAPGGPLLGSYMTKRTLSGCGKNETPDGDIVSMPPGRIEATSFDGEGKVDPKHADTLNGSQTLPGGTTTITWNLRLVKPKGK